MSAITIPDRQLAQRRLALDAANDTRCRRAQFKRDVKAGRESWRTIIAEPPSWAETMLVFDVLQAIPRVGRDKALRTLNRADVSPAKTIGGMTGRQRFELLTVATFA
jgi:hypothetical protein